MMLHITVTARIMGKTWGTILVGISNLLAVATIFTGSGNLYCQWELYPGSGNALCILFPTNASTFGVSPVVVELKDMVKALLLDKKGQNQSHAPVKEVEESCVTCGGAHSYRNYPATDGNVYRENIQELVSQASANRFIPNQNRDNNFNQGLVYQPLVFQQPAYQAPAYQAPAPQTQGVLKEDFLAYVKANDPMMKNIQTQGQNMQNQLTNLTNLITKFVNSNSASTSSLGTLPSNTIVNPKSDLKAITTRSGVSYDRPQIPHSVVENVSIFEPVIALVSASKPNPKASIPYPSRRNDERNHEKANNQIEKFYQIFKDMSFKISFTDALILMPKFTSTLKALIENKEKLSEMAQTLLNKHYSTVLLKKLPKKLGDPGMFLIPCDFLGMAECLALADLGGSINLMPFFVWKILSLPDLTPTCMTLELADHSISHPVGVAEDVYVKTRRVLIDLFEGELTLRFGKETITFNLDQTSKYSANYSDMTTKRIDVIDMACEEYSQEVLGFSDNILSGNPTLFYDLIVFATSSTLTPFENSDFLPEKVDAFLAIVDEPISYEFHRPYLDPEGDILLLEAFLNDDPSLPPPNQRNYLPEVRKELKIYKAKSDKLYPWVSPVHCVPKKRWFTVVENEDNELIPTRLVMGWRVYIDYRKLNEATRKDHFPLSFMDQMLERLAENQYYCFLDGSSGYFQILRCMMAIFYDMIEKTIEVFMDDFSISVNSFQSCLSHLEKILKRCKDTNLFLNWKKSHFMVKEGIVLGHKISKQGIKVDKAKVDVISKLPHPTVNGIRSILGHASFYRRFIKDFSKIARPMTRLLEKDIPFIFSQECVDAFQTLKRKLTEAPILIAPNWDMPFELLCDASDSAIEAVLGQRSPFKHCGLIMKRALETATAYMVVLVCEIPMEVEAFEPPQDEEAPVHRILVAIAVFYDYEIRQMDIKTAFLDGYLNKDIYMVQPKGFIDSKHPKKAELRVECYCDAGFETDRDDIKSQTGYVVFILNGGAVDWKSSKQSTSAMSATEAKYIATSKTRMEAVWIRKFISGHENFFNGLTKTAREHIAKKDPEGKFLMYELTLLGSKTGLASFSKPLGSMYSSILKQSYDIIAKRITSLENEVMDFVDGYVTAVLAAEADYYPELFVLLSAADERTGYLRYVQMAVTTYNTSLPASEKYRSGRVQVSLVWNARSETSASAEKFNDLATFLWRHILGERDLWEHVDVYLAPSSFGQANTRAFDSLLQKLHKYVPLVRCVEINKESKLAFEKTIERIPSSLDSSISWHHADTSLDPLSWLVGSDVLVVDPPRKGLDPALIGALRAIKKAERKAMTLER
uniref:Reverse transcriptase domain-containing protein n=1 Tax=Tanacetum cinerariifolium TaxID=118510 RepID=A0A6L2KBT7_TANCI|nr:reverse transcriptase domain-containing protein [Tanacetum cinerariifolium]